MMGSQKLQTQVTSIAVEPKKETCASYFKAGARNFRITNGMLYNLFFVYLMTFICFPAISNDTNLSFLNNN